VHETRELFANHNLRCTRQRLALFQTLRACKTHPTADELYRMVQHDGSPEDDALPARGSNGSCSRAAGSAVSFTGRLSRATVYNTLEALCRAGLVRKLPTTNGCWRFDADTSEHPHVKFRNSQEIRDVPSDLGHRLVSSLPRHLVNEIEHAMGVKIDGVNIQLLARDG
jgi:Fur family peroxide stress response transcriptional regulator